MRVNFKNRKQRPLLIYSAVVTLIAIALLVNSIWHPFSSQSKNYSGQTPLIVTPTPIPTLVAFTTTSPTAVKAISPVATQKTTTSPAATATPGKNIPIVDTSSWKQVSYNGISFMLPQSMKCYNYSKSMDKVDDNDCHNFIPDKAYLATTIEVENYQGGSRRQQYLDKLPNNEAEICQYKYVESKFGNIEALQIANNGGQCQGGGGAIVTVVGSKLVYFPNLNYDDQGQISRWTIRDTVVSTLKTL